MVVALLFVCCLLMPSTDRPAPAAALMASIMGRQVAAAEALASFEHPDGSEFLVLDCPASRLELLNYAAC